MTIKLLVIGKTKTKLIQDLSDRYINRLKHYCKFEVDVIPELKTRKNQSEDVQKDQEADLILARIKASDEIVLLDESGKEKTSLEFAKWMDKKMLSGKKQLIFIIGGPYGFSKKIYQRKPQKLALSKMTFSHEMIRPFFIEQLYRAFTILKNEPYHHQ